MSTNREQHSIEHGNQDKRRRRKMLIGLAAVGTAVALILGVSFAFFSDILSAGAQFTTAKASIGATTLTVYQNGVPVSNQDNGANGSDNGGTGGTGQDNGGTGGTGSDSGGTGGTGQNSGGTGGQSSNPSDGATSNAATYLAWGDDTDGALGDGGTTQQNSPEEVTLPDGVTFTQVAVGDGISLGIGSDGNVYAWGPDAPTSDPSTPVVIPLPDGVNPVQISAGDGYALILGINGTIYAVGENGDGQLGNGTTTDSSTPVVVQLPNGVIATNISAGEDAGLAVGSDGNVYAWGDNSDGQLGDGTTTSSDTPVKVDLPAGVTAKQVAGGDDFGVAIGSDGNVYTWGDNSDGQLGDGTTTDSSTPVKVDLPDGVTATQIAAGDDFTLVLGSDGNLYAFGGNADGQLGDGTTTSSSTPVKVDLPAGVTITNITAGDGSAFAVDSDGNVYAWGNDDSGQLGLGDAAVGTDQLTPQEVPLPDGVTVTQIASDDGHTLAVVTPPQNSGDTDENGSASGLNGTVAVIENLDPGDVITIGGTITASGDSPMWIRYQVQATAESAAIGQYLIPTPTPGQTDPAVGAGPYTSKWIGATGEGTTPWILAGVGANAEVPAGSVTAVPVHAELLFDPAATNVAQGEKVTMTVTLQAVQYDSNPTADFSGATEVTSQMSTG